MIRHIINVCSVRTWRFNARFGKVTAGVCTRLDMAEGKVSYEDSSDSGYQSFAIEVTDRLRVIVAWVHQDMDALFLGTRNKPVLRVPLSHISYTSALQCVCETAVSYISLLEKRNQSKLAAPLLLRSFAWAMQNASSVDRAHECYKELAPADFRVILARRLASFLGSPSTRTESELLMLTYFEAQILSFVEFYDHATQQIHHERQSSGTYTRKTHTTY